VGRIKKSPRYLSSNEGIQLDEGHPYIAVGDYYVPKPEHLENSYITDVPFKVIQIFNGDCVMLFPHNERDTTISPKYLLKYYRKATPVELEFYDLSA
jgi:hypothetical protein